MGLYYGYNTMCVPQFRMHIPCTRTLAHTNTYVMYLRGDGYMENLMPYTRIWPPNMYSLEFPIHLTRCMDFYACIYPSI